MDFLWIFGCFESVSSKYIQKINKGKSHEQNMDESKKCNPPPPKKKERKFMGLAPWI
jgi:hypothetical protein